jgi:UDPglucose 6-dehydrogenase
MVDGKPTIGFIGQGWLGKNYADDFERRGFSVVRFAKEPEYAGNAEKIKDCDIVFVAVPTPTTQAGFDGSIIPKVLPLVGEGKIAVIRSTLKPGFTKELHAKFPALYVFHAPEFLAEKTAAEDAANPKRNIVGIPEETPEYREKAKLVLSVLPKAPYELVTGSTEAELIKYAGNAFLMWKVIFGNIIYDVAQKLGAEYEDVRIALGADPRIGESHLKVIDESGHPGSVKGRGAGGHCFIKDFASLSQLYHELMGEGEGAALLKAFELENIKLLKDSGKDLDLLKGVYGDL